MSVYTGCEIYLIIESSKINSGSLPSVSCIAAAIGPVIGGNLATKGKWCVLFCKCNSFAKITAYPDDLQDLNLPISLVSGALILFLVDLPVPPAAYTIGLTWGGITAPWDSATVLVPLVLGLVGLVVFIAYEATLATDPLVRPSLCALIPIASHVVRTRCHSP